MQLANKEFLRLTGRGSDIIGKPLAEIFTEIEAQGFLPLLNRVLNNKETIRLNENPAVILINGVRLPKEKIFLKTIKMPIAPE